jgi:hypothetical protein
MVNIESTCRAKIARRPEKAAREGLCILPVDNQPAPEKLNSPRDAVVVFAFWRLAELAGELSCPAGCHLLAASAGPVREVQRQRQRPALEAGKPRGAERAA